MRRFLMPAMLALAVAGGVSGCYTADHARLGNFIQDTVQPGMPLEQALARMRVEDFYCSSSSEGTLTVCTRNQQSLMRGTCVERVDLVRSATVAKTVGGIDILEIRCAR